jgi:SAM-dependent methyltransferase
MALAAAIMRWAGYDGLFKHYVKDEKARMLDVLEINEAGGLSPFLTELPNRVLKSYPDIDMTAIPYGDDSFDLVLHSDTLEHVRHPVRALSECRRVLKPGGGCAFTVPMVVDRLTLSREGMPPSYHGAPDTRSGDYRVCTEYGADAWKHVIQAGFPECRVVSFEYPAAQALVGVK